MVDVNESSLFRVRALSKVFYRASQKHVDDDRIEAYFSNPHGTAILSGIFVSRPRASVADCNWLLFEWRYSRNQADITA